MPWLELRWPFPQPKAPIPISIHPTLLSSGWPLPLPFPSSDQDWEPTERKNDSFAQVLQTLSPSLTSLFECQLVLIDQRRFSLQLGLICFFHFCSLP